MYSKIMVPVDLENLASLGKALQTALDLAKLYGASICYVGVTSGAPSAAAPTPEAFGDKLAAFAAAQTDSAGVRAESVSASTHDPATELDAALLTAVRETGADLVVMGTHVPGLQERLWASHGGALASHAPISVMLVR